LQACLLTGQLLTTGLVLATIIVLLLLLLLQEELKAKLSTVRIA